jgi:hypothetical protein
MRFRVVTFLAVAGLFVSPVIHAQDFPPPDLQSDIAPPAHIAYVDGRATLDRENETDDAIPGVPLVSGDRLRTERGRVELLFPDGTALDIDEFSSVEMQSPTLLRVTEGRVLLIVTGANDPRYAANFHIDTPVAGVDTYGPGEYRLSLLNGRFGVEAELAVLRGSAALTGDRGSIPLRPGERSSAVVGGTPSYPQYFNSARFDAFDRWVDARRDDRRGVQSAQYLPQDLRMYGGIFDRDGSWAYESQYGGYVWYPTVAADWRPYYDGYWASIPAYGWTWVGGPRWGWPTHHYGRWGLNGARWYWVPDRRWGPAWVSWTSAPGYVGWCPLGYNNRPVFGLSVSIGSRWNGWNAWVVVPHDRFGVRHQPVRQWAIGPDRLPARTSFVAPASSPIPAPRVSYRAANGTEGRRARPGDRQWEPRPPAASQQNGGSIRTAPRNSRSGDALIYSNRSQVPQRSQAPDDGRRGQFRTAVPRQQDSGTAAPQYSIPTPSNRQSDGGVFSRAGRRAGDSNTPSYSAPGAPPVEHAPTIGSLPRGARRSAEPVSPEYAPARGASGVSPAYAPPRGAPPVSPAYAPPPSAPSGETNPSYRRRETPQYSAPPAPPAQERPRYQRDSGGARQDDGGGGRRAVPRDGGARASGGDGNGQQQGGGQQGTRGGESGAPRGARRGR